MRTSRFIWWRVSAKRGAHASDRLPGCGVLWLGRVAKVAEALRAKYPAAKLVIVPDTCKEAQAEAIARHVRAAFVEMPEGSPQNFDLNDYHQAHGLSAVADLLKQVKEIPQRFRLLTPAELAELPPIEWRVRGVLPKSGIAALFGPSGSGKSFLALDMLAAMAHGREWFGCRVTPCPVLYAALEGEAGISQRIQAHQKKHGALPAGFRFLLQGFDLRKPVDRSDLVTAARAAGYSAGVLVIDTLNRAAPGADENDSAAMGEIIAGAKAIQAELGGLVLLVHYTGKDQTKGCAGIPASWLRWTLPSWLLGKEIAGNGQPLSQRMAQTTKATNSGWTWWKSAQTTKATRLRVAWSLPRSAPGTWYAK